MCKNSETRIGVFQWVALAIGLVLLSIGTWLIVNGSPGLGLAMNVGGLGWFALGLMMSPQVRQDMFGGYFAGKSQPSPESVSGA